MSKHHRAMLTLTVNGIDVVVGEVAMSHTMNQREISATLCQWLSGPVLVDLADMLFHDDATVAQLVKALAECETGGTDLGVLPDIGDVAALALAKADFTEHMPEGWPGLSLQAKVAAIPEMDAKALEAVDAVEAVEAADGDVPASIREAIDARMDELIL